MQTIAIIAKPHGDRVGPVTREILDFLNGKGVRVLLEERAAEAVNADSFASETVIRDEADILVVLGGDGTLISAVRLLKRKPTPILGINLGRLGFMTETKVEEAMEALTRIIDGDFTTEDRMRLHCHVERGGRKIEEMEVINDVVINKGALARIVEIDVFIDNLFVNTYRADGLIFSTPTGSTAYNLAAGGPIVHPALQSLTIAPICPHSLTNRPIVVSAESVLRVRLNTESEHVFITYDGQIGHRLQLGDELLIKQASSLTKLIVPPTRNYYALLREKLRWGEF